MSLHSDLRRQTAYTNSPDVVSSDFLGTRYTGAVDGLATIADDHPRQSSRSGTTTNSATAV